MDTLDLYKDRKPYEVILEVRGGKQSFKIPTELTVEESERLLETEIRISKISNEEQSNKKEDKEKVQKYFDSLLEYILILLEHYQPEITMAKLKKLVTNVEALKIFEFFKKQRYLHILGLDATEDEGVKKKTISAEAQLDTLRQSITYLVVNGFGLLEVRKLYLDELLSFSNSLIYIKEKQGEIKEGTYKSLKDRSGGDLNSLKKQFFNIIK